MTKPCRLLASVAVLLASGCASVPMAPPEADLAAKKFEVTRGQANLYVYRNESFGSAAKLSVTLDGMLLGDTAAKTYLFAPIAPGKHTLVSKAEDDFEVVIDAKAGSNYFLWQEVKMGVFSARSRLQAVDEKQGRAGVLECSLARTNAPPVMGCTKDADCQGNRTCQKGTCVGRAGVPQS